MAHRFEGVQFQLWTDAKGLKKYGYFTDKPC